MHGEMAGVGDSNPVRDRSVSQFLARNDTQPRFFGDISCCTIASCLRDVGLTPALAIAYHGLMIGWLNAGQASRRPEDAT
jgi:hypothetical protein